jgi:hypothetical protein
LLPGHSDVKTVNYFGEFDLEYYISVIALDALKNNYCNIARAELEVKAKLTDVPHLGIKRKWACLVNERSNPSFEMHSAYERDFAIEMFVGDFFVSVFY